MSHMFVDFKFSRSLSHSPHIFHYFSFVQHVFHLELFLSKCAGSKKWEHYFSFYCAQIWCSSTYDTSVAHKLILSAHTILIPNTRTRE